MIKKIDLIVGARPNFMKISSIIRAMNLRDELKRFLGYRLVHTGQHYDDKMSESFFEQLNIPKPHFNLEAGSGSQAEQTAQIMIGYEKLLLSSPSDLCLVVGDVTSTMACAITAQKLRIPVAHVEAGIRSGDWSMPEEINRMVTDSITNYFFTTSKFANENLKTAGVSDDRVFFVGNTMIDTLLANEKRFQKPSFWDDYGLVKNEYFVVTMHRPSNVDGEDNLQRIVNEITKLTRGLPIVFPVHPRTAKVLKNLNNFAPKLYLVKPQPYLEFNYSPKL